jgi:hypothetical protein
MGVVAVKPCGDATVNLEFAETAFDEIALSIEFFVVPVLVFASPFGGNYRLHSFGPDQGSHLVGIVTFIGNHRLGRVSGQQCRGTLTIGLLPSGQQQAQRPAQRIAQQMNLRSQSATGSPQSLLTRPLFPVAAC